MDSVKQLFRKHLVSGILIILVFLIVNALIVFGIMMAIKSLTQETLVPVAQIAEHISVSDQWNVFADDEASALLRDTNAWAMVLDDIGTVIWEESLPEQLPRSYTSSDIAKFSRWYLDDYPVLVHTLSKGLLVVGYAPDNITKIYLVLDADMPTLYLYSGIIVIVANILAVFFLFVYNTRRVEKAVTPILNGIDRIAKGEPAGLSEKGQLTEISTELNLAGEKILEKDKARADWINGVSHDVRTPLSVMLGYAGDMEDDQSLPQPEREKASIIRKQGEKLRRLIDDLNLTSRLDYAMQPLNTGIIYPVELSRQVISDFINSGLDDKYQIEFDTDHPEGLETLSIHGDRALISRMLDNLIQNSLTHNPDGCRVTVAVKKTNEGCVFTVDDTGEGLPEEQLRKYNDSEFSESEQAGKNESAESGHGLGLRLVHQIAKAHKGRVSFESAAVSGLSVKVYIPFLTGQRIL